VRVVRVEGLEIVRDFSFVRLAGAEATGAAAAFQRFATGVASVR
jgi:LysR family transcriptional regulator, transcriptional activator of the cysJI operon